MDSTSLFSIIQCCIPCNVGSDLLKMVRRLKGCISMRYFPVHCRVAAIALMVCLPQATYGQLGDNPSKENLAKENPADSNSTAKPPTPSPAVLQSQQQRIDAMALATQSTVGIFGTDGQGGGSGVIFSSDGYVVTNFHVSSGFGNRMRVGMSDGTMHEAVIVGIDPTGDVALLKMYGRDNYPAAIIADSDTVKVGHWCFAAGNPFVLATNLQPTITYGIVSGVHRYQYPAGTILEYTDCIQTDAAINPGNSGGPLYNANGHLIGINGRGSFEKRGRVNVGVGYAISINQVLKFVGQLKSGRLVDHATLGFTVATDPDGKVVVSNILESSDAFRRGLRYGDEILSLAGRDISTSNQLKNVLGIFPSHWKIGLKYRNQDGTVETQIRLPRLHREEELWALVTGGKNPHELPEKAPKKESDKEDLDEPEADAKKEEVADPIADKLELRDDFVNYHFNRLEVDRIINLQKSLGDWKSTPNTWTFKGTLAGEDTNVEARLSPELLSLQNGDRQLTLPLQEGWSVGIRKQSPEMILAAMRIWQRWFQFGPKSLGDTHYFGDAPLDGFQGLVDVCHATIGEVECAVYTAKEDGRILLIELQGDKEFDPAEVYFTTNKTQDGRRWPDKIRLQYGSELKIALDLQTLVMEDRKETAP